MTGSVEKILLFFCHQSLDGSLAMEHLVRKPWLFQQRVGPLDAGPGCDDAMSGPATSSKAALLHDLEKKRQEPSEPWRFFCSFLRSDFGHRIDRMS